MRKIALLLISLSLAGCSIVETLDDAVTGVSDSIFGADNLEPPAVLIEYTPELQTELLWKESIGVGPGARYLKLSPIVTNSSLFIADSEGLVKALDPRTGDEQWEVETGFPLSAGPSLGETALIVASSHAEVVALNPKNGQQLWKTRVSSEVLSVPVIADGIVIIRSIDGHMVALNERDGHKLWDFDRNVPALSLRGSGTPVVEGDVLLGGFDNGKLLALRLKDGRQIWEVSIAMPQGRSEVERLVDLDSDPLIKDGVIFIASYQGGISAAQTNNGNIVWRNEDISAYAGMSLNGRYLYVTDASSDVFQLDHRSGASLWKQKDLHQRRLTSAVSYAEYVVVGDFEGYVHWLSVTDGRQLGRVQVDSEAITVAPVVKDNIVYVYAKDGTLAALRAR
ncbi:MAG: outer membrane protein assembly factor BamB [Methylococcales bacterium]|nr:outer membrane protein assembly factor BamB [Methylococcales bacterium]